MKTKTKHRWLYLLILASIFFTLFALFVNRQPANLISHIPKLLNSCLESGEASNSLRKHRIEPTATVREVFSMLQNEEEQDRPHFFWTLENGEVFCALFDDIPVSPITQEWYYLSAELAENKSAVPTLIRNAQSPDWVGITIEITDYQITVPVAGVRKIFQSSGEAASTISQLVASKEKTFVMCRTSSLNFLPILKCWHALENHGFSHFGWVQQ